MMADLDGAALEQLGIDLAQARVQPLHLQPASAAPASPSPGSLSAQMPATAQTHFKMQSGMQATACKQHLASAASSRSKQRACCMAGPDSPRASMHVVQAMHAERDKCAWYRYRLQANEGPCGWWPAKAVAGAAAAGRSAQRRASAAVGPRGPRAAPHEAAVTWPASSAPSLIGMCITSAL